MRRVAAPGLEDARERLTMPTDRVVEYDNAGIPKLFSIELLRRKRDCLAMVLMASLLPLVTKRCEFL
jgi:hypothetical protein